MHEKTTLRPMDDQEYREAGYNLCPVCRSDQVDHGALEAVANTITQVASCCECQHRWTLQYQLTGYADLRERTGRPVPHEERNITYECDSVANRAEPTPHPWSAAGLGNDLAVILGPYQAHGRQYDDGLIATMTSAFPPGETRANTRLIVSAPKLYAGCRRLVNHLTEINAERWIKNRAGEMILEALNEIDTK